MTDRLFYTALRELALHKIGWYDGFKHDCRPYELVAESTTIGQFCMRLGRLLECETKAVESDVYKVLRSGYSPRAPHSAAVLAAWSVVRERLAQAQREGQKNKAAKAPKR